MSVERLTAIHRRYNDEVTSEGKLDLIDTIFAPDYVDHVSASPEVHGLEGIRAFVGTFRAAFPDARFTVEDRIVEGDKLVARWTMRGTHHGAFAGVPATGKQVTVTGISIHRFEGDKIHESWDYYDALGLMQQLGAIPQLAQTGA